MRKRLLCAWIVTAASIVLIAAALSTGAKPGISFDGASRHRGYGLFVQLQCHDGCASGAGLALVQLTAGRPPTASGPCPYGTDALPAAPIVDGSFSSGEWVWLAPKRFVWLWVSGRLAAPGRLVGRIQGPAPCGGRDRYALRAGSASQ